MRGKENRRPPSGLAVGITPACAGKSERPAAQQRAGRDHPRVCGEKLTTFDSGKLIPGSPPRVRGKVPSRRSNKAKPGITPACAGKSVAIQTRTMTRLDHPRVCGEKTGSSTAAGVHLGSPPRVRGKASGLSVLQRPSRITPACAGKRQERLSSRTNHRDHPRVCGEKSVFPWRSWFTLGSPPRVRGKEHSTNSHQPKHRITPACAGKSRRILEFLRVFRDHPRVCGEKRALKSTALSSVGSPPRVRGKAARPPRSSGPGGITPACAGKS